MKSKRTLLLAGLAIVLFAVVYGVIRAQSAATGISVHPSNFDITGQPGKTATGTITVDNLTDDDVDIKVELRNFTAEGEEGSVSLTEEDTTYSLAKWIKVTPETSAIEAGGSKEFAFTVTAPENAEPGGHFGSIVFATVPGDDINGTGATLSQEVASLILFKIPGDVDEKASVESFTAENSFYEFGPVTFNARVRNEGGVHIAPSGSVLIEGWFGQKFSAPLEMRNVLPDAIRKIPATLEKKLLIGPYTATLISTYGTKGQQLYAQTTFMAFPVRYGLIVLAIIIVLFFFRKRLFKSLKILLTGK